MRSLDKIEIQFRNRRLLIDALGVVPPWMIGALVWLAFSELILKRVYPNDFMKMQGALLAADTVSELPPGVGYGGKSLLCTLPRRTIGGFH